MREIYQREPDLHAETFSDQLRRYGISLHDLERYEEACHIEAEAVGITRSLYQHDPDRHAEDLAGRLHNYGVSLHDLDLYQDACETKHEGILITRTLHQQNPDKFADTLFDLISKFDRLFRSPRKFAGY